MGRCQHCGQGAIAQDANGPVCPDCWEEGYYEMENPMTNETEAPERIWMQKDPSEKGPMTAYLRIGSWPGRRTEYVRTDLIEDQHRAELDAVREAFARRCDHVAKDNFAPITRTRDEAFSAAAEHCARLIRALDLDRVLKAMRTE